MKAFPDEFQSHGQPTSPVWLIVDAFPHPEFVFDTQLVQMDVEAAVVVGKKVVYFTVLPNILLSMVGPSYIQSHVCIVHIRQTT